MGVLIGAIGITSGPLSTQDGGTSDRSLKAATNPSRLPRRLRLLKRYISSPACFALQILAQAPRAGTKALREGYARMPLDEKASLSLRLLPAYPEGFVLPNVERV
jgi:hypothetical protein